MSMKIFGGALGGVTLPLVIEFGAKGAKISDTIPYKWSGIAGTGIGVVTGILPLVWGEYPLTRGLATEDKYALEAFGGASFATGIGILILDELRKRAAYTFKGELPLQISRGGESLTLPPEELIKEI